jgi:hypothetical protein
MRSSQPCLIVHMKVNRARASGIQIKIRMRSERLVVMLTPSST